MERKLYKQLCRLNEGYGQVRRSLKALARHPALHAGFCNRHRCPRRCAGMRNSIVQRLTTGPFARGH